MLKKDVREIARQYYRSLQQADIPVQELLVFGSHARGTTHPGSDVDIAVVSPAFGKDAHAERVRLMRLADHVSTAIEPHPFHPRDFNNRWNSLVQEIRTHGIKIAE